MHEPSRFARLAPTPRTVQPPSPAGSSGRGGSPTPRNAPRSSGYWRPVCRWRAVRAGH